MDGVGVWVWMDDVGAIIKCKCMLLLQQQYLGAESIYEM
jgi:hypothetical protein